LDGDGLPYWTSADVLNGVVKFKFTATGKTLFASLYKRKFEAVSKAPLFVAVNVLTKVYDSTQKFRVDDFLHVPVQWYSNEVKPKGLANFDSSKVQGLWEPTEIA
jgi:hypothetical protein